MKKRLGMVLLLWILLFAPMLALAQTYATVAASVEVVSSFSLSKVSDVAFGEITSNMTRIIGEGDMGAGKVLSAGVRNASMTYWVSAAGTGTGAGDVTSTITLSDGATPLHTLTLSNITLFDIPSSLSATGKPLPAYLDSAGNGGVEVGGTLNVPDATIAGTYIGSLYVFAEYD